MPDLVDVEGDPVGVDLEVATPRRRAPAAPRGRDRRGRPAATPPGPTTARNTSCACRVEVPGDRGPGALVVRVARASRSSRAGRRSTPSSTAGSFSSGSTSSLSATSKITQGPDVASSVRSGWAARRGGGLGGGGEVVAHPHQLEVPDARVDVEACRRAGRAARRSAPRSSSTWVRKWNGVVADASKNSPSIEPMQPSVQCGRSISAIGVP